MHGGLAVLPPTSAGSAYGTSVGGWVVYIAVMPTAVS